MLIVLGSLAAAGAARLFLFCLPKPPRPSSPGWAYANLDGLGIFLVGFLVLLCIALYFVARDFWAMYDPLCKRRAVFALVGIVPFWGGMWIIWCFSWAFIFGSGPMSAILKL